MGDPATTPSTEASVAWLAAYALGLAYAETSDQQRLTELVEATRGHLELLEAAHQRLDAADVAERSICDDALQLLERAVAEVRRDRAPADVLRPSPSMTMSASHP